jgi:hypothetical protein
MSDRNIFCHRQHHEGQVLVTVFFYLRYEVMEKPIFEDSQRPLGLKVTPPYNRK